MPLIQIKDTGCIYRSADTTGTRRQAYFPSIVALPENRLLAAFDLGTDMEHPDVRTCLSRSNDGGHTWSEPEPLCDRLDMGFPMSTLGRISRLADGAIVGLITVCDRSRTGCGLANPASEGFVETYFQITESQDEGRTWSTPRPVRPPIAWRAFETCSPIFETGPDRWLLPTSLWRNWNGDCPHGMKAVAFLSEDHGVTWTDSVDVFDGWAGHVVCWEQKHTRLTDGRCMAVCWAYDYAARHSKNNLYSFSEDAGATFSQPSVSPLHGETCTPLALADNHVLCLYRRCDSRGLWAHLARMDGAAWIPRCDAPIWGAERNAYGARLSSKTEEMTTLQFGYPQAALLTNGSVFVVFWCVEDGAAMIRWARVRVRLD